MSDLSMLFTTSLINKSIDPFTIQSKSSRKLIDSSLHTGSSRTQKWDLAQLQASIKKQIKKEISLSALSEEVESFDSKQKSEYSIKALIFGGIIALLWYLLNFDKRIVFYLALVTFARLAQSLPFKIIQQKIIRISVRIVHPFAYSALFYHLLKSAIDSNSVELNTSVTITSILFSIIYVFVCFLEPCFTLSSEHIIKKCIEQKGINKIAIYLGFIYERFRFYKNIKQALVSVFFVSLSLQLGIVYYIEREVITFFQMKNFIISIGILILLEIIFSVFNFINFFFDQIKTLKNKMHVFIALLRIEGDSSYRKAIQDKCLINILNKTLAVPCFLGTQTCKSLIYDTYMDLFNQFASIQLQKTNSRITKQLNEASVKRGLINSQKTLIDDLFIHFRKALAYVSQQLAAIKALESLSQSILILRIIALADQQAHIEKQPAKPNSRLIDLMEMIQQKLGKLAGERTILPFLSTELMFNQRKLSGWISSIRKGWI